MSTFANYAEWAAQIDVKKVHAVELTVAKISNGSTLALYFADDTADNGVLDGTHFFEPYIKSVPRIIHKAASITGGNSFPSYGALVLAMERGVAVDPAGAITWDDLLSDYAFFGRPVAVKVGGPGLAYADWGVVLTGFMSQPSFTDNEVTIPIYSKAKAIAETELPAAVYGNDTWPVWQAGQAVAAMDICSPTAYPDRFFICTTPGTTGATEPAWTLINQVTDGTAAWYPRNIPDSTVDKPKPLVLGQVKSIRPVLIDAEYEYSYHFHDSSVCGLAQSVDAVYIDGKAITSGFSVNLTSGVINFNFKPEGDVTLDVRGAKPDGTYIDKPGDIVKMLLTKFGGVATGDIDAAAFSAFNTDVSHTVGAYITSKAKLSRVIDSLLNGLLAHWGTDRDGKWGIERFQAPAGSPVIEFTDLEILEDTVSIEAEEKLLYKMTIAGDRCWNTDTGPDATVSTARRAWLADKFREREASSSAVQSLYPDVSQTDRVETHLANLADCATVAGWWLSLFGARRRRIKFTVQMQGVSVNLGDVVRVTTDTPGFTAGQLARVVSVQESHGEPNQVAMEAWL